MISAAAKNTLMHLMASSQIRLISAFHMRCVFVATHSGWEVVKSSPWQNIEAKKKVMALLPYSKENLARFVSSQEVLAG